MSIEVKSISSFYSRGSVFEVRALKEISFRIEEGEFIGLIGPTGSGKSTLIQHLNGLMKPDEGSIRIGDFEIQKDSKDLSQLRRKVGLVFQYPEYQLFEENVYKDIAFGPRNLELSDEEIDLRVREAMEMMELSFDNYAERSPFDLSGGEKRRVAIAGVLAMKPEILMLDEPTAGLDPFTREELLKLLKGFQRQLGMTLIMVSHSMDEVSRVATRILAMKRGELVFDKSIKEAFEDVSQIEALGLDVPVIVRLFSGLRDCGFSFPKNLYSLQDAIAALKKEVRL